MLGKKEQEQCNQVYEAQRDLIGLYEVVSVGPAVSGRYRILQIARMNQIQCRIMSI